MKKTEPSFIALSVPHMAPDARASMDEAFDTNWIAQLGATVDAFENELAAYVKTPGAFATHSGTDAIHLAMALCDVGPGDVVFCSSLTFIASANPVLYRGATPTFIDSDPETWCMSPRALERALDDARKAGKLPKAIVVANLYGQSADLDAILALASPLGIPVVEDAAESLGATYKGRPSGTLGRIGIYSFAGNKIITTSTGGMLVSPDKQTIERARFLGVHHARGRSAQHYEHEEVGYNYRMSNVLAGIGRSQLRVLDQRVNARRAVFARYVDALSNVGCVDWMPEASFGRSTRWLSCALLKPGSPITPSAMIDAMAAERIELRRVFKPLHMQPLFAGTSFYAHDNEAVAERLFAEGVCLPSSSSLTEEDQDRVISVLRRLLGTVEVRRPTELRGIANAGTAGAVGGRVPAARAGGDAE